MPKYSILTSDRKILSDDQYLEGHLSEGIKVLAFCDKDTRKALEEGREKYLDVRLLQVFLIPDSAIEITIDDGQMDGDVRDRLEELSRVAGTFNLEQYIIEHADPNDDLIVEAGAGTGKTTVMIDRIMYLIHTVPGLSLEDIGMITFTNEATQSMKHKIQSTLINRYKATESPKYVRFLEEGSKIRIQTIHSFSNDIISELGTSIGYSQSVKLRSYKYEKRQLIHDVLNEKFMENMKPLTSSLGLRLHELDSLINDFWTKLENLGLTDEEILALDWGNAEEKLSKPLHDTLRVSFEELNKRYNELKMSQDAISVGDIVRELRRILDDGKELVMKSRPLKYLFVDEFQDSDNAQINMIAWIHRATDLKLFVVGDVKQSIYRFRGAVETAFDKLRESISEYSKKRPQEFTLMRNYRTSKDLMDSMDPIFKKWEDRGWLDYGTGLVAQKKEKGYFKTHSIRKAEKTYRPKTISLIRSALDECMELTESDRRKNGGSANDKKRVTTVLVRTNYQLNQIAKWCEEAKIPCYIRQEGTFYSTAAVREFFSMIKAHVFQTSTVHMLDYINSSYVQGYMDLNEISTAEPESVGQLGILESFLTDDDWIKNKRAFRLRPVLSVLREIIDKAKPVNRYISKRKMSLSKEDWSEEDINQQLAIEATQYEFNLEKLMKILRSHFAGDMSSLYQIYRFLQINILTNRKEDEPDVSGNIGSNCVYGMTVHKAKGLEFDTVLIPLTHRVFRKEVNTEIILDESQSPRRIGWSKVDWVPNTWDEVKSHLYNDYYFDCLEKEKEDVIREEARLLYVALTRAERRLECFAIGEDDYSWAHLLEG